jgi:hypothetical protein
MTPKPLEDLDPQNSWVHIVDHDGFPANLVHTATLCVPDALIKMIR